MELKFRAWDIFKKRMFESYDWEWIAISKEGELVEPGHTSMEYSSKEAIIMQYVGKKDINGKEIYADDLVRGVVYGEESTGYIRWSDDGLWVIGGNPLKDFYFPSLEVLGNFHEIEYKKSSE